MALASVAMAETASYVNNELQNAITLSGYSQGQAFSLSFTIASRDNYGYYGIGNIITLDDSMSKACVRRVNATEKQVGNAHL